MMAKIKMPGMLLSELLSGFALHDPVPSIQIFDIAGESWRDRGNLRCG
jgi:hypothetical protein